MRALNHRQLQAFRAVMICGSMTGAGAVLNISQPAVTRLIQGLEAELALSLFQRHGAHIRPTADAIDLYRDVERYFASMERVRETAIQLREGKRKHLRIATMSTLSSRSLPEAVRAFQSIEPEVDFAIHSDTSMHILDALQRDEFDVGFGRVPPEISDIDHMPMPTTEAICLVPSSHDLASEPEVSVHDLDGEAFVSLGTSSLLRLQIEAVMQGAGVRPGKTIQTLYSNTVGSYVGLGLGIAVTDIFSVMGADMTNMKLRRFRPMVNFDFSAVFPRGGRSPLADSFARTMHAVVSGNVAWVNERL